MRNSYTIITILLLISIGFAIGLLFGSSNLSIQDFINTITTKNNPGHIMIIWDIRMPRIVIALVVGAGFAISGALLQTTTRNPLGDPQLFGITGGALIVNAFAVSGILNVEIWQEMSIAVIASILGSGLIYYCSSREQLKPATLALIGFSIGAMSIAISTGIMAYSRVFTQQALGVIGGSTANLTWDDFIPIIPFTILGIFICLMISNRLHVLVLGDTIAKTLGVNPKQTRLFAIIAAAILSGASVNIVGSIGLLGLITPHITRIIVGNNVKTILLYSIPFGSLIMIYSDQISRLVFMPYEVPVGLVITIIGAPIMIYLAWRHL